MDKTERVGVDIRIALTSSAKAADLKRRQGLKAPDTHPRAPSTARQKIKALGRTFARACYRVVRPIARPVALRMRAFFSGLLQQEIQHLHLLTTEKLAQQSRQQQQLTERLLLKHTAEILRALKEPSGAASLNMRTASTEPRESASCISRLIQKVLATGDTFVDIGSGVGEYTPVVARALGPMGRLVAFDPFPPACEPVRLDDLLGQGGCANLVKIQASAANVQVLEGASGILEANPNIVLIVERVASDGPTDGKLLQFLTDLGFERLTIDTLCGAAGDGEARTGKPVAAVHLMLFARPNSPAWVRLLSDR